MAFEHKGHQTVRTSDAQREVCQLNPERQGKRRGENDIPQSSLKRPSEAWELSRPYLLKMCSGFSHTNHSLAGLRKRGGVQVISDRVGQKNQLEPVPRVDATR
jgi:hypothetical protein